MNPKEIFEAFNGLNILIVGDVMLDRYLRGKVERMSPEAPVPIVRLDEREHRLGGAANVALNVKALGANPILCSVIGNDKHADLFERLLPENGIDASGMIRSDQRCTTVKTRILAANQHLLRVDEEDLMDLTSKEQALFYQNISSILANQKIDVLLFQDYNKGVLSLDVIRQLSLEALREDILTVVDPKHKNFLEFKGSTLFKPNLKEIREACPFEIQPELASLSKASDFLRSKMRNHQTMITLSEKGIFIDDGDHQSIIPTQARNIADVCGAGDTVISVAALGTALQMPLLDIAVLSNLAGGQVCEKVGVVPVEKAQLLQEYEFLLSNILSE